MCTSGVPPKTHRQSIGRLPPVPNPMSFWRYAWLFKSYRGVKMMPFHFHAAPFGIRTPFPSYRVPQLAATRARALLTRARAPVREPSTPPRTGAHDRPAVRTLDGSMSSTWAAHPERRGSWGAALGERGGTLCKTVGFCANYSQNEPM